MGHQNVGYELIRGLLRIPDRHNQHTAISLTSCMIDLALGQAVLWMDGGYFRKILLLSCFWPKMGNNVCHDLDKETTFAR